MARGAVWLTATRVLVNLIGLASTILLARLLLPGDFGLVAIAATIAAIVGSVTELPLASALVQHKDPQDRHFDCAWTLSVMRATLFAGSMAVFAAPLARLCAEPRLVDIMYVLAATAWLCGLANPKLVIFTRNLVFWQEFAVGISQKLFGFVVAVAIAVIYKSYWALILGGVAAQLLALVLSYVLLPYRPRLRITGARELLGFSIWLSFGRILSTVNWRSDHAFIGYFLGSGPLGYYSFGDNIATLPTREATAPIAQTLFPAFSRLTADPVRLRNAYQRAQALMCAIALPIGFGFAAIAQPLLLLTVGEKWQPAVIVVQMLASIFAIQALSSSLLPLAMAMGETRLLFWRDLANFAVRMPLMIIGLTTGGLIGVLVARLVSDLTGTILNLALVRRLIGLSIVEQLSANYRALAAICPMVVVLIALQQPGIRASEAPSAIAIAGLIGAGITVYVIVSAILFSLAGRPPGPEQTILAAMRSVSAWLGNRVVARHAEVPR